MFRASEYSAPQVHLKLMLVTKLDATLHLEALSGGLWRTSQFT